MAGAGRSPPSSPLASAASPRPPSAMAARGQGAAALGHGGRSQAGHVQVRAASGGGAAWRVQGGVASSGGAEAGGWVAVGGGEKAGGGAVVDGGRRVVQQNHIRRKRVFSHSKYMIKKKEKMGNPSNGSIIKWLMFRVLFLRRRCLEWRICEVQRLESFFCNFLCMRRETREPVSSFPLESAFLTGLKTCINTAQILSPDN